MFTFHWSELLVIVLGGLALFFGLALLMLRRRNEILQDFLTPDEPNLEVEFFGARKPRQAAAKEQEQEQAEMPLEEVAATTETSGTGEANHETEYQETPHASS